MSRALRYCVNPRNQQGMALITGMLLLLVMTVLGIAMFRSFGMQARIAGNTREKQRAVHAAEAAQAYAEWWLSAPGGVHATVGTPCTGPLSVTAGTTQACSNPLPTTSVTQVPWMNGTNLVGVTYVPYQLQTVAVDTTPTGTDLYAQDPLFYISYLRQDYLKASNTLVYYYRIDATGYGGTNNAVSVVESSYQVNVSRTTSSTAQINTSLTNP